MSTRHKQLTIAYQTVQMSLETEYNNLTPIMPQLGIWVLYEETTTILSDSIL